MKRIDTATRAVDLFGAGKDGFRNSNKGAGIAATQVDADWCNHLQEELANVIEDAGIVLDSGNRAQLKEAIQRMIDGGDYKPSVRVASTTAINLAAPGANIDGVAMVAGDRFLEKDHGTPALRGIYIWNGAAVPATRAEDFDDDEVTSGLIIPVEEGTVNANTNWQLTTDGAIVVGTTALTFQTFTPSGATESAAGLVELANTTEVQAASDNTRAVTPAGLAQIVLGLSQTWQNVTASRAIGVSYTNSTGRAIQVAATVLTNGTSGNGLSFLVAGTEIIFTGVNGVSDRYSAQVIVPPGATYSVATKAGTSLEKWHELRN